MPLDAIDADGLCYIIALPNGTDFGLEERRNGAWSKWKSEGPYVEGPEEGRRGGVFWSAYYCKCVRSKAVDWRYYFRQRIKMVEICLDCGAPRVSQWDDLGPKNYYKKQTLDVERKTVPGGITMQSEAWMDMDCEGKCDALNHK